MARQQGRPVRRIQRAVANTIVGQMLPPGVVKGGTAMKLRVGEASSRFTPDLDVARSAHLSLDDYLAQLGDRLAAGWSGFTGTVMGLEGPRPEGVRFDEAGITDEIVGSRRVSSYFVPIPAAKKRAGQLQFEEWTGDRILENAFINRVRSKVAMWRAGGWQGVTPTTS